MTQRVFVVVTSIFAPSDCMVSIAQGATQHGWGFVAIGDSKSPSDLQLDGCYYYSLDRQRSMDLRFPLACPVGHYARKNIGYLAAIQSGADLIVETDDDNLPLPSFWDPRTRIQVVPAVGNADWVNVYRYFIDAHIWPRGFPLDAVRTLPPNIDTLNVETVDCPIQQGLADGNPDVDAVYRLLMPLPVTFRPGRQIALRSGSWCPFNSQNTTWWRDTFPLLYLPAYCSFRMTDIWRGLVAQRIAWANDWGVLFHGPSMRQERNSHDLMKDFRDEVPGYLGNREIAELLWHVKIRPGVDNMCDNLRSCYDSLARRGFVDPKELDLLEIWLQDIASFNLVLRAP